MGCLLVPAVIALLAWANVAIVRSLHRRCAAPGWWAALLISWVLGGLLGAWTGFCFEYQPSPRLRVIGAPVPAAFLHWEGPPGEERWVGFITPVPLVFAASNVILLALLATCLVGVVFWLRYRRARLGPRSQRFRNSEADRSITVDPLSFSCGCPALEQIRIRWRACHPGSL